MEMRFYEKIGVRQWKKFVLWLMAQIVRNPESRKGGNYYLAGFSLDSLKDYRKQLWPNTKIHIFALMIHIISLFNAPSIISFYGLLQIAGVILNLYCIMLQRYNYLRIKRVLDKVGFN